MTMRQINESISVSTNQTGEPVGFLWRNSTYRVRTKPIRWFARRDWWIEAARVQRGVGAGVLEVEMWRMIASKSDIPEAEEKNQFELVHSLDESGGNKHIWRIARVSD
jgi:hypothetical protein